MKKINWLILACMLLSLLSCLRPKNKTAESATNEVVGTLATHETAALNAIILQVQTLEQIEPAIKQLQAFAQSNRSNLAAQIYQSVAHQLPLFRGFIWRLRKVFFPIDIVYLAAISELRNIKYSLDMKAPYLDALFEYLTQPNPQQLIPALEEGRADAGGEIFRQKGYFEQFSDVQDFLALQVAPVMQEALEQLKTALKTAQPNTALFNWDIALAWGQTQADKIYSPSLRYKKVLPAHLLGIISGVEKALGIIYYAASYQLDPIYSRTSGLTDYIAALTKSTFMGKYSLSAGEESESSKSSDGGWDASVFRVYIQTPKERYAELMDKKRFITKPLKTFATYQDFLRLRDPRALGESYLQKSLALFRASVVTKIQSVEGYQIAAKLPNQDEYVINAKAVAFDVANGLKVLQREQRILNANKSIVVQNYWTNEPFHVHIAALFDPTRAAVKDLKLLVANQHKAGKEIHFADGHPFAWNYEYGQPIGWPDPTFGGLLPDSTHKNVKEARQAVIADPALGLLKFWLKLF